MTVDELSDAELNALSDEGLRVLGEGGTLEDLGDSDLQTIASLNTPDDEQPGWFQENIGRPIMDKLGDVAGAIGSLSSETIRKTAANKMIEQGLVSPDEKFAPGIGDQALAASELFLENAFDSVRSNPGDNKETIKRKANPEILADVQAMDYVGASLASMNVVAMAKGQAYIMTDDTNGLLMKAGNVLSVGEQMVARGTLTALASLGAMSREDAIMMMSQTQVHGSDLVDYFWLPKTPWGKVGRGITGFAADAWMDPLSYLTVGSGPALRNMMKEGTVKVGNRIVTNPNMLSRMERQALLAKNDVLNVVRKDGRIQKLTETDNVMEVLDQAINDKGLAGLDGDIVERFSKIDPELGAQVNTIFQARQTEKGVFRSLADRDLSVNFAFRLPFTRIGIETDMPLFGVGTRWGAQAATGVKDWTVDSAARISADLAQRSPMAGMMIEGADTAASAFMNTFKAFKTFTTRPLWDSASNTFINKQFGNSSWARRQMHEAYQEVGADAETSELMVRWLNQSPTLEDDDLIKRFVENDFNSRGSAYNELGIDRNDSALMEQIRGSQFLKDQAEKLRRKRSLETKTIQPQIDTSAMTDDELMDNFANATLGEFVSPIEPTKSTQRFVKAKGELNQARAMADQTMTQLELRNPKAAKRVRQIREQFVDRIYEMEKRGIPFRVLNPFDETIPVEERAMGYFPHILNPDYINPLGKNKYDAALGAFEDHMVELGLADATQAGRRDRRSTQTIIDSVKKASGINDPVFVNDPISASYSRMEDMDNLIAQYDMFKDIFPLAKVRPKGPVLEKITEAIDSSAANRLAAQLDPTDPGRGWIEFDPELFSTPVIKKYGKPATVQSELLTKGMNEQALIEFASFLPQEYKMAARRGAKIYFPEDVANRVSYLLQREKGGTARSALDFFNYMFRNGALFGLGYQGMNALSNTTTYMTARANLTYLPKASKFLYDARNNSAKIRNKTYTFGKGANQVSMTGEQLYNLAAERGVLSNSIVSEADIVSDVWDILATTKPSRDKYKRYVKSGADLITGFKLNRHAAEASDNMFRMGLFMDSLDKGYTINGAKERLDMFFYDFRDVSKGQRAMSQWIPFSSFGVKSLESVAARASKLDFKALTIPYYAAEVLDGAFVDDYQTRQYLKANLPLWMQDQTLGDALPGGQNLMLELPFMASSLKMFLNPADSVHPLVQSLSLLGLAMGEGEAPNDPSFEAVQMDSATHRSSLDLFMAEQIQNILPPTIKFPITLHQLKNPDEVRSLPLDFVKKYKVPTLAEPGNPMQKGLTIRAQEFGDAMAKQSPDWLYNGLMYGQLSPPYISEDADLDKKAMYGRFVRSKMRDMTLGLARVTDMDRAVVSRMAAIQRQMIKTKKKIVEVNRDAAILRDPLATPKLKMKLEKRADRMTDTFVAEMTELKRRQAALAGFYGFYLQQEKSGGLFIDMLKNAIKPEGTLTEQEAQDQNDLIEGSMDLIPGRVKKLELDLMKQEAAQ